MSTICAISTPNGKGGIAVIRISGSDSISIANSLFHGKHNLNDAPSATILYGNFANIDDVLISIFRNPHSFTGEDTIEISCHGSIFIQQAILEQLISHGCTLAQPGEFTQRAFLNGKIDLTQAEAVADLIAAENKAAHNIALAHLRGGIKDGINTLRSQLLHLTSLLELELDFADHEDLTFADRQQLLQLANTISQHITQLLQSFTQGNAIKNGITVAIIGATNAGKSTLLNQLVGEERAIVSNIHGTTRDTIEDSLTINGVLFRLIDTAGIRQTDNEIENIGIQRSQQAAHNAAIILHVIDATNPTTQPEIIPLISDNNKTIIHIYNKADLIPTKSCGTDNTENSIFISAKNAQIQPLISILQHIANQTTANYQNTITNIRHKDALQRALYSIGQVTEGLNNNLPSELLALDLHDCLDALGEITGQITSQEVLNNIFSHFCIGK